MFETIFLICFLNTFTQAYDSGLLTDTSNIGQMMSGMLEGLLGRTRRRYSVAEKSFYAAMLSYGGPLLHDFVSKNLFGPNIRTSRYVIGESKYYFKMYNC